MSDEQKPLPPDAPDTPFDAGSQALSEALKSSFWVVQFVMVVLLVLFIFSGVFNVGPDKQAILLRLGKPVGEGEQALLGPGLHWSFPYPIDDHLLVSIKGVRHVTSTLGWYATTAAQEAAGTEPPPGQTLNPAVDGYVFTADGNIVHSRAWLDYHISDPIRFEFSFLNSEKSLTNALDSALLYAGTHFNVDDILTRDVIGFREAVTKRVRELIDEQKLGVVVEQCTVQSIPPRQPQVKDAFANVLKAEVIRSKVLNDARSYENQVTNRAGADAIARVNRAESDRVRLVNEVASRAAFFQDLLPNYRKNPSLFANQRYLETMGRVFTNAQRKVFFPEGADGNKRELRYLFNDEFLKPKPEETKP